MEKVSKIQTFFLGWEKSFLDLRIYGNLQKSKNKIYWSLRPSRTRSTSRWICWSLFMEIGFHNFVFQGKGKYELQKRVFWNKIFEKQRCSIHEMRYSWRLFCLSVGPSNVMIILISVMKKSKQFEWKSKHCGPRNAELKFSVLQDLKNDESQKNCFCGAEKLLNSKVEFRVSQSFSKNSDTAGVLFKKKLKLI